jgi:hypothetical protein
MLQDSETQMVCNIEFKKLGENFSITANADKEHFVKIVTTTKHISSLCNPRG